MSTHTEMPKDQPTIVMTRIYDAPRELVWEAITEPDHVRQWWGGPGYATLACEMDVRPGGRWNHVMRFPDGREMTLQFVYVEVEKPARLIWRNADGAQTEAGISPQFTATFEALGQRTRWTLVARFTSVAERDAAVGMGFTGPIANSNEGLVVHLERMKAA
jgi:uncharacterized protein YndB with AHSA1/START domain